MKLIFCVISFLYVSSSIAQDSLRVRKEDSLKFEIKGINEFISISSVSFEPPACPYTIPNAMRDIEKDSLSLIIHGGFTGFGNIDEQRSLQFQKKYNVTFVYLGCIRYWDVETEDTQGYNQVIFSYLEEKYGGGVKKEFDQIWLED